MNRKRLGIVGDTTFDYYLDLTGAQSVDEKVIPVAARRVLGGTAANAAVVARSLGSDVSLHSVVGDDAIGSWILASLQAIGLGTDNVRILPGPSPIATVLLGASRTVIVDIGVGIPSDGVDLDRLRTCDLVYVSYSPRTVVRLIEDGQGDRTVVGLEAWMLKEPGLRVALDDCQLLIANEAAVTALGETAPLPSAPILETRGGAGAVLHQDGTATVVPPYPVSAVDSTGAGDCFAATVCHFMAGGSPLLAAAKFAAVAAALSTQHVGPSHLPPSAAELEKLAGGQAPV